MFSFVCLWRKFPTIIAIDALSPKMLLDSSVADWLLVAAGIVTAAAAVYAAINGVRALNHQRDVDDVKLSYDILKEVSTYWDEMLIDEGNRKFHIGQILMNFEYAASLFNRNTLSKEASEILSQYMIDTMAGFENDEDAGSFVRKLKSDDESLSQLSVFLQKNQST